MYIPEVRVSAAQVDNLIRASLNHPHGLQELGLSLVELRFLALLQGPHLRISPVALEQRTVRPPLDDAAMIHHQNLICVDHGRQAMGNHQRGAVLRDALELALDRLLRARIER